MKTKTQMRRNRVKAIRHKVQGTAARPRLTVHRSNTRMYVQMIDDATHVTLFSAWTKGANVNAAKTLAAAVVEKAKAKKIDVAVFDRSGYRYHGAVKALADSVREGGIRI